ncbi:MAG TPA: response regulator transcription factor [Puia sp.]|jgi:two-component system KDP operon response regulator KdpE|nr:response regulator transcription factor [Puia sp.]
MKSKATTKILVIDDETSIRNILEITLQTYGYSILQAATAREGLQLTAAHSPDLILLDLGLPDESGHTTLKKMREWFGKPVIILSVFSGEADIIAALDNGANDYLVKPFRTGELLARIRSALRSAAPEDEGPVIRLNGLEIDLSSRTVKRDNELLKLTATQYALLVLFGRNVGKVLTHQYLLREIWGSDHVDQLQYLRVFIAQLRKKIEKDVNYPEHIITESGVGYRFLAGSN